MSTNTFNDLQSGWLHKLSWVNIHRSWRKRFFVLSEKELRYYKNQGDARLAGTIDLKHYRGVSPCATKLSPWSFRIESGCRHHFSHILYADTEADRDVWMRKIRAHILKQSGEHDCHFSPSNNSSSSDLRQSIATNDSVLDKWLERLDLQESSKEKKQASSPTWQPRSISTSLPHHIPHNNSTISCYDFPDNSSSSGSSVTVSPSSYENNQRTSMLANAFALNAQTRLRRWGTTTSVASERYPLSPTPTPTPSSPQSTFETSIHRDSEWSALDLFHFEEDTACRPTTHTDTRHAVYVAANNNRRSSMELSSLPPSLPPPTSPLPPPPRATVHRRLSEHTHHYTSL
ncbi:hypothetical protein BJV82DRAFT_671390 [Fennellomyces sp. T-0311]|nr:hypothetical protein BJV82DRAFT_671390 [Fennellomyces sp. T-0311]